ncbi:integrase, partial [Mycobacterium tuberculosis]
LPVLRRRPAGRTRGCLLRSTPETSRRLRSQIRESPDSPGRFTAAEPGFFEGDTVAHCGPTLKGEFAHTLNLTDVHIGWVFTRTVRNNARTHILAGLKASVTEIPHGITGLDFDNGTVFLNKPVISWAGDNGIYFTRFRPYKKNH